MTRNKFLCVYILHLNEKIIEEKTLHIQNLNLKAPVSL